MPKIFVKTEDFNYRLPLERIAQNPLNERDQAKLMVLHRYTHVIEHRHVHDLVDLLTENDVLVFNETKVFPARLKGTLDHKPVEILLHQEKSENTWECLVKPGKKFQQGTRVHFKSLEAIVTEVQDNGSRLLTFSKNGAELMKIIEKIGETPLPPYI